MKQRFVTQKFDTFPILFDLTFFRFFSILTK